MNPQRRPIRSSFLVALAAASALAVGCAQLPSQPLVELVPPTGEPGVQQNGLISGRGDLLKGLLVRTLNLVGSIGGTVANGRWKVSIPAGAVDGNATVVLGVQDAASSTCQLEILPVEKNKFRVPVTLSIDCRNVSSSELKNYGFFWFNPTTGKWDLVEGCKVDLTKKTVSAPLLHFSKYKVGPILGKAGW